MKIVITTIKIKLKMMVIQKKIVIMTTVQTKKIILFPYQIRKDL